MAGSIAGAVRTLQQEIKNLNDEPVEGFRVKLKEESNIFEWEVSIFGPPGTLYEGGYFKATMTFPSDYPFSPPTIFFNTKMWHPNIYADGKLCISILHPPGDDPSSGELPSERWNPTQSVRTVLLSVISLLNEPNTSSPANVDASVMFRKWKESGSPEYVDIVKKQVEKSKADAEADGVSVPLRVEDYVAKSKAVSYDAEFDAYEDHADDDYDCMDECDDDAEDGDVSL